MSLGLNEFSGQWLSSFGLRISLGYFMVGAIAIYLELHIIYRLNWNISLTVIIKQLAGYALRINTKLGLLNEATWAKMPSTASNSGLAPGLFTHIKNLFRNNDAMHGCQTRLCEYNRLLYCVVTGVINNSRHKQGSICNKMSFCIPYFAIIHTRVTELGHH